MRPYQRDSYRTTFRSEVAEVRGDRVQGDEVQGDWVRLSETFFYPTSGGQPHDTGVLEGGAGQTEVVEVKLMDAQIWHRLEGPPLEVGEPVDATLDWARRYRHMQRHSAQHLLSQVFTHLDPAFETRAVSLSGSVCTLDLSGEPDEDDLQHAEVLVNRVAYANLEIRAFEIDEREVARYPLRRPPKVSGRIRLVQMGDFELSACGGTHLRSTAEALPIKLLGRSRVRGGLVRVQFSAGWEALDDYRSKHESVEGLARGFSAQARDVPEHVAALKLELAGAKRALAENRKRLAQLLAETLRQGTEGPICHILAPEDADLLAPLAHELVQCEGVVALLAVTQEGRAQLLFARHERGDADMRAALDTALAPLGGRGGGSAARAQGGGSATGLADALAGACAALAKAPRSS